MRSCLTLAFLIGVAVGGLPGPAAAQSDDIVLRGAWDYHEACASCHGPDGNGDGAMGAILKIAPPELTTLSQQNGGVFPFERVFRVIDGRDPVEGHGSIDMPVWGSMFRREARDEGDPDLITAGRVYALARYLEAIQGGRKIPLVAPQRRLRRWPRDIPVWPDQR
jgi:mono/diheme cytochrome c family protein